MGLFVLGLVTFVLSIAMGMRALAIGMLAVTLLPVAMVVPFGTKIRVKPHEAAVYRQPFHRKPVLAVGRRGSRHDRAGGHGASVQLTVPLLVRA